MRFFGKMKISEKESIKNIIKNPIDRNQIEMLFEKLNNPERNTVKKMLEKYFGEFKIEPKSERHNKLKKKMGRFNGNLCDDNQNYNYFFSGIKVYPPLGFDPWPKDKIELKKVKELFSFCERKRIPVTTHYGTTSFQVIDDKKMIEYTFMKWSQVLKEFKKLKINLAHFGSFNIKWARMLFELILKYENVYTDFSCECIALNDYKKLSRIIKNLCKDDKNKKQKLLNRIMFGTDFMINLMDSNSYFEYLSNFFETGLFPEDIKKKFCAENPKIFYSHENFL